IGRVEYVSVTDAEAVAAYQACTRTEGIIPALESAHAVAHAMKIADSLPKDHLMVVNMSGRGDKDLDSVSRWLTSHPS
ncbi:MAG: Tryptophan synthase beta chain, partial [Rhodospirillales bacterium]|nr:Tryptophan synthase beta chain [Rhodospirillales bacterium]